MSPAQPGSDSRGSYTKTLQNPTKLYSTYFSGREILRGLEKSRVWLK